MNLRRKLLLAQLPLTAALVIVGVSAVWAVSALSVQSQLILQDNYRSALAMERIKESIERLDSAALFVPLGRREKALVQIETHRGQFETELKVQEGNITEPGEEKDTQRLRDLWTRYQERLAEYLQIGDPQAMAEFYFSALEPAFLNVKRAAEQILTLNQDAMVEKSRLAQRSGNRISATLIVLSAAALIVGAAISLALTNHLLTPLSILAQGVNRLAEGDFQARAFVSTEDEIGQLAAQFNTMAEHLQEYRNSSLGELLMAQQAAKAAIDSIPDAVILFNPTGNVLEMNRAAELLLGQSHRRAPADPFATATPELRSAMEKACGHVLQGKGAFTPHGLEEAFPVVAFGDQRWLMVRATPVHDRQGSLVGATVILQDVTRLRRFDELRSDVVATVAHEFRTPLTSLRMAIHLCLEGIAGPVSEKQADLLEAGREDCQRLQTLVDELLDLARIQSGAVAMQRRDISARALVENALRVMQSAAREKGLNLEQAGFPLVETVSADAERIQLVFSNLIGNSIRHTPSGGSIRLSARVEEEFVRFEVTDSGEGIPYEHQPYIFERFYRVPGAASGAAGLGLALSKEIIEAHGGQIGVISQPSAGSTFWFTLPIATNERETQSVNG